MASYHPNPFDFVPFVGTPVVKTAEKWAASGVPVTGYFEVFLKAITPVHISDFQKTDEFPGKKTETSRFYQRNDDPLISATTIRGCLRAFLEAACNCWVSEVTPEYEKVYGGPFGRKNPKGRHIGFSAEDVIAPEFFPDPDAPELIDFASYLFGCVLPKGEKADAGAARKGRISIEDAEIDTPLVWASKDKRDYRYKTPDIADSAFMGGAHPSASSWWYMHPHEIRIRKTDIKGKKRDVSEFVGGKYRGRKFYFHQNPEECVRWYFEKWPLKHKLYPIRMQCLPEGGRTKPFRIYFEELPEPFLNLLLFLLAPAKRIHHKLGYGTAYGHGSVEFSVIEGSGKIRKNRFHNNVIASVDARLDDIQEALSVSDERLSAIQQLTGEDTLHAESLDHLARILWYDAEKPSQVFSYPPFAEGGFLPGMFLHKIKPFLTKPDYNQLCRTNVLTMSPATAARIAKNIHEGGGRKALHFEVYQENATGYQDILQRTFETANL